MDRYNELLKRDNTDSKDLERKSLFYILANNEDLYSRANSIYDFEESFMKAECLDGEIDLTSSSRQLIQLAFNLYNGYESKKDDVMSLLDGLDDNNFKLAIEAIKIRFGKVI